MTKVKEQVRFLGLVEVLLVGRLHQNGDRGEGSLFAQILSEAINFSSDGIPRYSGWKIWVIIDCNNLEGANPGGLLFAIFRGRFTLEETLMADIARPLTGKERSFPDDEIIVSKTDKTGRLTYVNDVFLSVSGYEEAELIGQPHSIVRHPQTPRCLFKLMWDRIESGKEIFVYVNNRAKCGDHYWVFAHITPHSNPSGQIVGYHSNRRVPKRSAVTALQPLYQRLLHEEERHADRKQGLLASAQMLMDALAKEGKCYEEFILSF